MVSWRRAVLILLGVTIGATSALAAERIVSLYPGHGENLVALGAQNKLVGLSTADDPKLLPDVPRVSGRDSAEAILALKPDLVLSRSMIDRANPELRKTLESFGVTVVDLDPPSWNDFGTYLDELSKWAGLPAVDWSVRVRKMRNELAAEAAAARGTRPAPRVFLESTSKELYTASSDSWAACLLALVGAKNVASGAAPLRSGSSLAPFGSERLLEAVKKVGLDWYLIQRGAMDQRTVEDLRTQSWFTALGKVRAAVVSEALVSRPSLSGLTDGAWLLIRLFYGDGRRQ